MTARLGETPAGLLLTPGASADRDHATLVAIDDGLPEIAVERLTLGTTSVNSAVRKIVAAAETLAERNIPYFPVATHVDFGMPPVAPQAEVGA